MRARLILLVAISALFLVEAYPQVCEAKGKKGAVKKKKPKKPRDDASVSDNPYASEEQAAEGETAAADEEEAETKSAAETTAEAVEGGGEQAEGEQGGFLQQGGGEAGSVRRSNRMEFDERLVKGQAAKSGAVYLFKRVPRRLPGLVPMRRSYRKRIVEPVLGERELKPAVYSEEPPEETAADAPAEGAPAEKPAETEQEQPAKTEKDETKDEKKK